MKVAKEFPPNYDRICEVIPAVKDIRGIVFTYGDTIYNPDDMPVEDHLDVHESVHQAQQAKMGIEEWWEEYLKNPQFRLEQELEAYRAQYQFTRKVYGLAPAGDLLKQVADDLSGTMYGNIMRRKDARKAIMQK